MKADIHPPYFPNATVMCACGTTFTVGSTKETIQVEICSKCHPFYTGQKKLVDTAGRVERFEKISQKAAKVKEERAKQAARPKPKKKLEVITERQWRKLELGKKPTSPAKK